jgi:hypothetical protein
VRLGEFIALCAVLLNWISESSELEYISMQFLLVLNYIFLGQVNHFSIGHYYHAALQVADKFMKYLSGKKPQNCKLIISAYDYKTTPSVHELLNLVAQIRATGADIVKIETTAADIVDTSRMFQVLAHCHVSFTISKFVIFLTEI